VFLNTSAAHASRHCFAGARSVRATKPHRTGMAAGLENFPLPTSTRKTPIRNSPHNCNFRATGISPQNCRPSVGKRR
jgi:hypothetical protein